MPRRVVRMISTNHINVSQMTHSSITINEGQMVSTDLTVHANIIQKNERIDRKNNETLLTNWKKRAANLHHQVVSQVLGLKGNGLLERLETMIDKLVMSTKTAGVIQDCRCLVWSFFSSTNKKVQFITHQLMAIHLEMWQIKASKAMENKRWKKCTDVHWITTKEGGKTSKQLQSSSTATPCNSKEAPWINCCLIWHQNCAGDEEWRFE